jgi:hypothetical protein
VVNLQQFEASRGASVRTARKPLAIRTKSRNVRLIQGLHRGLHVMRILTLTAITAGLAGALIMTADPADAAPRKKRVEYYTGDRLYSTRSTPRARIAVRPRSYLDAGTEVLPGERKYTDYAIPPGYSAINTVLGPSYGYDRRPLNDYWDVPHRYGY